MSDWAEELIEKVRGGDLGVPQDTGWDKALAKRLLDAGMNWEQARYIIGIVAEQRQTADRLGFTRGFKNGYESGYAKGQKASE